MNPRRWTTVTTVSLLLAASACGGGEEQDQRTGSISPRDAQQRARDALPLEVIASIDSGNTRYRAGEYEAALEHFRAALARDSSVAAAWFGLYMTQKALGNPDAADRALERAGEMAGSPSMLRPAPGDTTEEGQ